MVAVSSVYISIGKKSKHINSISCGDVIFINGALCVSVSLQTSRTMLDSFLNVVVHRRPVESVAN